MALIWNWDDVMGELRCKGVGRDGSKYDYVKRLYKGNCLAVLGQLAKLDGSDEPDWTVFGEFWGDRKHLSIMLGLKPDWEGKRKNWYADVKKARLNSYYLSDIKPIMDALIKARIPVEVFYKAPKAKKGK